MKNIKQLLLLGCWLLAVQAAWAQNPNCSTVSTENEFTGDAFVNFGSASDAFNSEYRSNFTIGQPVVGNYFGQDFNGGFGFWARNYLSPAAPVVRASEGDLVDRIKINWQPDALSPAAGEGYKIYRDGSLLATVDSETSSFIDFNVIAGIFYEYEVAGINSFGEGQRGSGLGFLNPNGVVTGQVKSGSGNPVPGAVVTLTPSLGSALAFDGVDDMAFAEYNPIFPRDAFTLSCWVKLEGTNDNTGIFDMGSSISKNWWLHTLPSASGKGVRFGIGHGAATELDYTFPTGTEDDWHFIAATYNGESLLLYGDGELLHTEVANNIQSDSIPLFFGRKSDGTGFFNGKLDEVRFFDRQIPQTELNMFMNRTVAADAEGLVAYWKFDEGIGSKAFDQSATKSTTFFCGSQWTSDRPEVINAGISDETGFYEIAGVNYGGGETFTAKPSKNFYFNQSLEFSAVDETYADLTDFDIPDTATISVTFKAFDFSSVNKTILSKNSNGVSIFRLSVNNGDIVLKIGSTLFSNNNFGSVDTGFHSMVVRLYQNGGNVEAELFDNGVSLGAHTYSYSNTNWSGRPWAIGANAASTNSYNSYYTGLIDEVAFFDTLLSLSDIQTYANIGTDESDPNLIHYFNLNEGSGTELNDMGSERTDSTGTVHGALWSTVVKHGEESAHEFSPSSRLVTLNPSNTSVDQVDFTDLSSINVTGYVRYEGTGCFVDSVEILVDGSSYVPQIFTDEMGKFSADFEPGATVKLSPKYEGHSFTPPFWELRNLSAPVAGVLFQDQTKRKVTGQIAGGYCRNSVIPSGSTAKIKVATKNECFVLEKTLVGPHDGFFEFENLPPDEVTVAVSGGTGDFSTIFNYFNTQGGVELDLTEKDDTTEFLYFAPPEVELTALDTNECGEPMLIGLSDYDIDVKVFEDYFGDTCYLDTALLIINNNIADLAQFDTLMTSGTFKHQFTAGGPNIISPYFKNIQITANVNGEMATDTTSAVVLGRRARQTDFASTAPEIPTLILRDPPGDGSSAFIEESSTSCNTTTFSAGGGIDNEQALTVSLGGDITSSIGFGFLIETDLDSKNDYTLATSQSYNYLYTNTMKTCLTATEKISTNSDNDDITGSAMGGDVYMGTAVNYVFGITDELILDTTGNNCAFVLDKGITIHPNGIETAFAYTERDIINEVIPDLEANLMDTASADRWRGIIELNNQLKNGAVFSENISFGGGVVYERSEKTELTETVSHEWKVDLSSEFKNEFGFTANGIGVETGLSVKIKTSAAGNVSDETQKSRTVGYTLLDNDIGDLFTVNIKKDPVYGTPVFDLIAGQSQCPHEPNTLFRQEVAFSSDKNLAENVAENDAASFELYLGNLSQSEETQTYMLQTIQSTNTGGAVVLFNGQEQLSVEIPYGETVQVIMTVERGIASNAPHVYEDLQVAFFSECEFDINGLSTEEELFKTIEFDVYFVEPCSPVDISDPQQGWVQDIPAGDNRNITIFEYNEGDPDLELIRVQYRRTQGDGLWINIAEIPKANLGPISTNVNWDTNGLPDGLYEIRAITQCFIQSQDPGISHIIKGKIERTAPELFGTPEPADGVLSAGDEISITFNEPINCANIIQADQTQNNNVGLYYSETGNLIDATISCSEDKIIIVPNVANQFYENKVLRVEVDNIEDLVGNTFTHIDWEFFADQNPLRWAVNNIEDNKYEEEAKTLYREITNEGGSLTSYTIHGSLPDPETGAADPIPNWVNVFPLEGLLAPGEQQIITFEFDEFMPIGEYADTFYMSGLGGDEPMIIDFRVLCRPPEWEINPAGYINSMNFTVELDIEGELSADNQDIVGAFIDGELRGFAYVQYVAAVDSYLAFLNVYSNNATGETVDFRIWDASDCHLYGDIIETYTFIGDEVVGTPDVPVTLHTSGQLLRSIPLHTGWNWISFNLEFMNDSLDYALASLDHPENDYIKSQTVFTSYTGAPVNSWDVGGLLDTLNNTSLYLFEADQPDTIDMVGLPIDLQTTDIPIVSGWNWIGYLPQSPLAVDEALASLSPLNGDVIKGQASFAQYLSGLGWIGSLEFMQAPEGYMLKMANAGTLTYPENFNGTPIENRTANSPSYSPWSVNAPDFEHSMTIVGVLSDGMDNVTLEGQTIGAFVGDEVRGVATATYIEQLDEHLFFLTIFAKETQEQLTFKLYDESTDKTTDLQEQLFFDINLQVGTPLEPMPFTRQLVSSVAETDAINGRLVVMPNPFRDLTTVHFQAAQNGTASVAITDAFGKVVDHFELNASRGWNRFYWEAEGLSSGVYFLRVEIGADILVEKVVLDR